MKRSTILKIILSFVLIILATAGTYVNFFINEPGALLITTIVKFIFMTVIMMAIPIGYRIIESKSCSVKSGRRLCKWNILIALAVLMVIDIIRMGGIYDETFEHLGANLVYALLYYYINSRLLFGNSIFQKQTQTSAHNQNKRFGSYNIYGSDIALHKEEAKIEEPIVEQVVQPAPRKGEKKTPPKWMIVYHICLLLLVCFLAITNAIQYDRTLDYTAYIQTQQEEYDRLSESYETLNKNYQKIKDNNLELFLELNDYKNKYQDKLDFMDEYVVFIEDDGTDWYHKYDCSRFKGNYFWALNVDAAIVDGYTPCRYCH